MSKIQPSNKNSCVGSVVCVVKPDACSKKKPESMSGEAKIRLSTKTFISGNKKHTCIYGLSEENRICK